MMMNLLTDLREQIAPAKAKDALELIHSDHEEVSALFKTALDDKTPSAQKKAAIAKILAALTLHAKMEEKIFYPALRKAGKQDEKDSVLEAAEEHGMVKDMIAKIKRVQGRDETLEAKVTVLKEMVEHHVKEEESEMFDEARKVMGKKLQALGEEMQAFKDRANGVKPAPARRSAATKAASTSKRPSTSRKSSKARA